jgi:teichuronic acid biosynthesis glycosyltransferase TuaC
LPEGDELSMKVLCLSHMYPSHVTPMYGSFVHNQVRFLQNHVDIDVVSPVPWWPFPGAGRWSAYRGVAKAETLDGVHVDRPRYFGVPRRLLPDWTWKAFARSVRPFLRLPPSLIHAHAAYPDGLAALELGRHFGVKVVITVHGSDVKTFPELGPGWRRRVAAALRGADGVIAVSRELAQRVADFGVPAQKIERIPNGVDSDLFALPQERAAGVREWRLLFVGRFNPVKGLEDLLHAMAILRRQRTDIRLDLVGGDPYSGTAAPYVDLTRRLGLEDCVQFHGSIPMDQVPERLAQADVFVLPSHSEGLPLALLEALATGMPVVATRCGGPSEIVTERMGRLANVQDPAGLAQAIGATLDGYGDYDRAAIRESTVAEYDYQSVAARIHAFYERIVDAG